MTVFHRFPLKKPRQPLKRLSRNYRPRRIVRRVDYHRRSSVGQLFFKRVKIYPEILRVRRNSIERSPRSLRKYPVFREKRRCRKYHVITRRDKRTEGYRKRCRSPAGHVYSVGRDSGTEPGFKIVGNRPPCLNGSLSRGVAMYRAGLFIFNYPGKRFCEYLRGRRRGIAEAEIEHILSPVPHSRCFSVLKKLAYRRPAAPETVHFFRYHFPFSSPALFP